MRCAGPPGREPGHRSDRGKAMIMALLLLGVFAVVIPALLGLTLTGTRVTASVREDRRESYVATSALDVAIQHGRTARWVGRFGLECPTLNLTIDREPATVVCSSTTGAFDLDRAVTYQATVAGITRAEAAVVYRDGTAGFDEPAVEVVSWDSAPTI